jgi:hypothetical protein
MRPFRCHAPGRRTSLSEPIRRHASHRDVGDSRGRPKSVPMFAADGVVRSDSLGPAPLASEAWLPVSAPPDSVSPELALIDAELARALRAGLPEPAPSSPVAAQALLITPLGQELQPELRPAPAASLRPRKLRILGLVALGALLTVSVRSESRPAALDRVAGVAAEPDAQAQTPEQTAHAAIPTTDAAPAGQTFVWAAEPGAAAYEFQLFRGAARIYRARVTAPRLFLPGRWRQDARTYRLAAASYRWYVWPISARTGRQAPVATVQATLAIARPTR